ncbi:poly polymerase catalytic domain-containing protein [Dendryphion nanum]|uniref:Poly [ADP-ribose] polymerase n=1 Tax=Dendryphion nanum TaxID=256645 RepID=A0A9P9ISP2_9PLEO|nr:poly polymerase catalytic domain-containing protein [Dendryphion nanum]
MPPKRAAKAAKAAPPPSCLDGLSIAISGTFPGTTQAAVQSSITSLGASVAKSVTADTHFLVSTQADVDKSSIKVKSAQKNGIPIVTIDWLNDSASSNTKEDPNDYLLSSGGAAPAPASAPASAANAPAPARSSKANGKKRAASPPASLKPDRKQQKKTEPNDKDTDEPKFGEGSYAKSNMVIPLDEGCALPTHQVYIGDDGIVYDASLNQTNASNNNNKFYRVQLLHLPSTGDFRTWTRWGRVGDHGQTALLGDGSLDDAMKNYEKKFKDKSGLAWKDRAGDPKKGKYAYVERSYAPDSDDEEEPVKVKANSSNADDVDDSPTVDSKLALPVQSLMELIFNQQYMNAVMTDLNYDAKKMPLGKLSQATIHRGFQCLKDLAALIQDSASDDSDIEDYSNSFYSLIPHNFGRNRPPIIRSSDQIKKELELLESLADMKEAAEMMKRDLKGSDQLHVLDRQFRGLGLAEMSVLEPKTAEFEELATYLNNTRGSTHGVSYDIQSIFRIERNGESTRFNKSKFAKINSDRRLLWHGSRTTNFGGILSQGLRIAPPEAPVSGYMFGKGIYLADMSSKSANYCCSYSSGGHALLLLCEAELGDPLHELTNASYTAGQDAIAKGSWSTWGKGTTGPSKWKDAGCVHPSLAGVRMPDTVQHPPSSTNVPGAGLYYNEFIAYDVAQVRLRYLFRVKM